MNARLSDSAFLTVQISRHRDGSYYSENADLITAEIVEKKIVIVLYFYHLYLGKSKPKAIWQKALWVEMVSKTYSNY